MKGSSLHSVYWNILTLHFCSPLSYLIVVRRIFAYRIRRLVSPFVTAATYMIPFPFENLLNLTSIIIIIIISFSTFNSAAHVNMRLLHLLLTVGLAMLVQADRMSTEFKTHAVDAFIIKDFLIYNIVSTEWRDHSTRLTNRNITCMLSTYASALDFIADLTWSSLLIQTPTRLPSARMDGPNLQPLIRLLSATYTVAVVQAAMDSLPSDSRPMTALANSSFRSLTLSQTQTTTLRLTIMSNTLLLRPSSSIVAVPATRIVVLLCFALRSLATFGLWGNVWYAADTNSAVL
ncbi:hypothetical protein WAI453_001380 [Rhynchosporium graminicola]